MNEIVCRDRWVGILNEATRALDAMDTGPAANDRQMTAVLAFQAAAAAAVLGHHRTAELAARATAELASALAAASPGMAARIQVRLSLAGWLAGQAVDPEDLDRAVNFCVDDLIASSDSPEATFLLMLRCYVQLMDVDRLQRVRTELADAWQAAVITREGQLIALALENLEEQRSYGLAWCAAVRRLIASSISWEDADSLDAAVILQYRHAMARAENDRRSGWQVVQDICLKETQSDREG